MFKALVDHRQGVEVRHDVYCSECGLLALSAGDDREGGQPDIFKAGVSIIPLPTTTLLYDLSSTFQRLDRSTYSSSHGAEGERPERPRRLVESEVWL